jgi:16S rRNA G966 N2-methylase RsmD
MNSSSAAVAGGQLCPVAAETAAGAAWVDGLAFELSREHPCLGLRLTEIQALNPSLYSSIAREASKFSQSLRNHPSRFHLETPPERPHRVRLVRQAAFTAPQEANPADVALAATHLELAAVKTMAARSDRLRRRRRKKAQNAASASLGPAASGLWLLTAVRRAAYYWMRLTPAGAAVNRADPAAEPMSPEWCRRTLPMFTTFILARNDTFLMVEGVPTVSLCSAATEATQQDASQSLAALSDAERTSLLKLGRRTVSAATMYQRRAPHDTEGLNVERMCRQYPSIKSLVEPNSRLLSALRMASVVLSSKGEESFEVYSNAERNGKWFVRMDLGASSPGASPGASDVESLIMDEEGAYSLTGRKAARMMAKILHNAWRDVLSTRERKEPTTGSVCLDLSAGVGGNSFELGKAFDSVHAFELDQERCKMLRSNLKHHGVDSVVTCTCGDSVQALRNKLPGNGPGSVGNERLSTAVAAILDPPWGGTHYNTSKQRETIRFSGLTMSELVVEFVGMNKSLRVLGIKLPLSFDVTGDLADKLSGAAGVRMYACKNIFRQRFVVFVAAKSPAD